MVGLCHTEHVRKNWDNQSTCIDVIPLKHRTTCPYIDTNIPEYGITSKDAGGTAVLEQTDLGLQCLFGSVSPRTWQILVQFNCEFVSVLPYLVLLKLFTFSNITNYPCVCSRFYQWYQWYINIVQGKITNATMGEPQTEALKYSYMYIGAVILNAIFFLCKFYMSSPHCVISYNYEEMTFDLVNF